MLGIQLMRPRTKPLTAVDDRATLAVYEHIVKENTGGQAEHAARGALS